MNLTDLVPDPIIIQLDRPRKLEYKFRSWRYLEDRFGSMEAVLAAVDSLRQKRGPVLENLLYLLWAGLIQEDPSLTVEQVEDWLDAFRFPEYALAVSQAIVRAFPPKGANENRPHEPGASANGTGAGHTTSPGQSAG